MIAWPVLKQLANKHISDTCKMFRNYCCMVWCLLYGCHSTLFVHELPGGLANCAQLILRCNAATAWKQNLPVARFDQ